MSDLTLANSQYQSGALDTATTLVDNVDDVMAQHVNGPNSGIIQIETILGNGPTLKGNKADLATRLGIQMDADGNLCPIGSILMYGGSSAPTNWLLCDGSAVSRTTYLNLFNIISTTYGVGDGSTTFNVPDLRGRVAVGVGTGTGGGASGTGLPTGGSALTAIARGTWKGTEDAVNISHTHTLTDPGHLHREKINGNDAFQEAATGTNAGITDGTSNARDGTLLENTGTNTTGITMSTDGVSGTGLNIAPVLGLNFIIRT